MSDDDKAHEKKTYRPMTYTKVLTTVLGCRYAYHNNERELMLGFGSTALFWVDL